MAFPASTVTKQIAWERITKRAVSVRGLAQRLRNQSAAGATERQEYLNLQKQLDLAVVEWDSASGTPGLQAYARDQIDDPTLNLVAEYQAMRAATITLRDWIFTNIPRDAGSGAVLTHTVDQAGDRIALTVSTAATQTFRDAADVFLVTIS